MGVCRHCRIKSSAVSNTIGFCANCIRSDFDQIRSEIEKVHARSREAYGLAVEPPRSGSGPACDLCFHQCRPGEGYHGYCGQRRVQDGRIRGGRPHEGNLSWYFDPLPTNCVSSFVCPAGSAAGGRDYSYRTGPEYGYYNLAVFYQSCGFNCLYCQNYHFKKQTFSRKKITAADLARVVDNKTACICYFGGDPTPQVLHALKTARLARRKAGGRILRICWESNGSVREPYLSMMAKLSLESGGCIKFDLKAWDEKIHLALCGVSNQQTLSNFKKLSVLTRRRPEPPFLVASTLLVPGYIDEEEVGAISTFLADLNPEIPYSLLGFYPHFHLSDLPLTSRTLAQRCLQAAQKAGLKKVHIGNEHLLSII